MFDDTRAFLALANSVDQALLPPPQMLENADDERRQALTAYLNTTGMPMSREAFRTRYARTRQLMCTTYGDSVNWPSCDELDSAPELCNVDAECGAGVL